VIAKQGVAWRGHQGRKPGEQLERGHHARLRASVAQLLDAVRDAPSRKQPQPAEREGRARAIAQEAFAPEIVVSFDGYARLEVETVEVDGAEVLLGRNRGRFFRIQIGARAV
jgi:hypothetical protein